MQGTNLAVATYRGRVLIWDVEASQCIRRLDGHVARVGALAWNGDLLASGSRDRQILLRDVRADAVSGGGPSGPTHSSSAAGSANNVAATATTTGGPYSLVNIDRELLSNSVRASFGPLASAGPTATSFAPPPPDHILPDLGYTCPGGVRVLKDHKQEVRKWRPIHLHWFLRHLLADDYLRLADCISCI